ncbi:MAG: delta-60 repeat domain-containing protein [Pyrinomonadaceae bacterium]
MILSQTFFMRISIFTLVLLMSFVLVSAIKAQSSEVDLSFNAVPSKDSGFSGNFVLQPDGKILAFGGFQIVNGVLRNYIARLNQDGSLDASFNCTACDFPIGSAIVQPDGKIIIAGSFFSSTTNTSAAKSSPAKFRRQHRPLIYFAFRGKCFSSKYRNRG